MWTTMATLALMASPPADVTLELRLANPVLEANRPGRTFLKIGLVAPKGETPTRAKVNLALVLDRSSSMEGEKLAKAKEAAIAALAHLADDDLVSVVTYDSTVDVLVPATVAANREAITAKIRAIESRGSTALFGGVSKGLAELRKGLDGAGVNRIILLSDGQANVGPSSPNELGRLGASAAKSGVSVTTIGLGLGYNEDLMVQLARKSGGNHAFVENAAQLAQVFGAEMGDVLSVVAKDVWVRLSLAPGFEPLRVLGRDAELRGRDVLVPMNHLYGGQEKYVLVELAVPSGAAGTSRSIGSAAVTYLDLRSGAERSLARGAEVAYAPSLADVDRSTDAKVMVAAVEAVATEANREAVVARDQGDLSRAKQILLDNSNLLKNAGTKYQAPKLSTYAEQNELDAESLDDRKWSQRRKVMRGLQHKNDTQQSF